MGLPTGKLPSDLMDKLLGLFNASPSNHSVVMGPKMGQDTGAIDLGDELLIVKANPVTFATDEIGFYAVTLNANDISLSGAVPKWFSTSIFLPENHTDIPLCEKIFAEIANECDRRGIQVIGGHTEVTYGINRPIVAGFMLGIVKKEDYITTLGAKPGELLMMTKFGAIEGTAIIAREKSSDLRLRGFAADEIAAAQSFLHNPGISITEEATFLSQNYPVTAMHGPTEGGIAMGAVEMAKNSKCGLLLDESAITYKFPTRELCSAFHLDPLRTISSGTLLFSIDPAQKGRVIQGLKDIGIHAAEIGHFSEIEGEYMIKTAAEGIRPLSYSHIDEIVKIFEDS